MLTSDFFPPEVFERLDESDDPVFYAAPRKAVHIDEWAVGALRAFYKEVLPSRGVVLDLMSSWRSHLPEWVRYGRVVGIGLNAEEMADNPALDEYGVQDLNRDPRLPFGDRAFDGVIVSVSVQYMTKPVEVFREVGRVLKPDGPFCVAFSDRCFWDKAIRMWRASDNEGHIAIVRRYFEISEMFRAPEVVRRNVTPDRSVDPMFIVWARRREE
ncbi:MAG: methyltransferase domain-containing protein [Candidatus Latescibacteria bacterium]|nr:methyltransferase domain-containing protein [Candidatus Latescibacterota bacterium]